MSIVVNKYNDTVKVEEYNGMFSLVQGYIGKDGNEGVKTCERYFGKEKKKAPISVTIGNRDTAADNLRSIFREIYGDDEAVPF